MELVVVIVTGLFLLAARSRGHRRHGRLRFVIWPVVRVKRRAPDYRPADRSRPARRAAPTVLNGTCWVVDGDTIIIDKMSIRLAGIDAPELDHPYGNAAKFAMVKLCKGQTISAHILDGETSHERLVARCYLPDGRDLAAELVKMGLAIDWPKYSGGRYRHLEIEGVRQKLWRCDLRQKGLLNQSTPIASSMGIQR